ncbi:MAG TPA: chemotaxis protein CheW [Novosphingobium sp.]|nr:chemotaxis protein CheW [Novosphingobium sp.]HZV10495.1 chemotaxis protein CheW [Novosphingobium sp.]
MSGERRAAAGGSPAADAPVQAVTFGIGSEIFAVPVAIVREILDHQPPFRLPNAPDYFAGLIDVRGVAVPTIDLRRRLGLPAQAPTALTRIFILEVPAPDGPPLLLGLTVDRALVVSAFAADQVEPPPRIGVRWRSEYITGVIRQAGSFIVLIDIARVLTSEDAALIAEAATDCGSSAAA